MCVAVLYVGLNVSAVCRIIPVLPPTCTDFLGSPVFIYSFVFVHILTVQTQIPAAAARKRRTTSIFTLLHVAGFETSLATFETCPYIKYCLNSADIVWHVLLPVFPSHFGMSVMQLLHLNQKPFLLLIWKIQATEAFLLSILI